MIYSIEKVTKTTVRHAILTNIIKWRLTKHHKEELVLNKHQRNFQRQNWDVHPYPYTAFKP